MANFVVYHVLNTDVKDEKISATIIIIPIIKIKFSVVFNPLNSYKLNPIPLSRMPGLAIRLINGKIEKVVNKAKTTGEPPLMLAMSVFYAIKDAIASVGKYKIIPILDAPATPEKILMSLKELKNRNNKN